MNEQYGTGDTQSFLVEIEPKALDGSIVWGDIFGNSNPVEIEIGFGKGTFLNEASRAYPDRNFFGIEPSAKYVRLVRGRAERWGRPNVRVHRGEAKHFITHFVPDHSVSRFHIYHPDPWPKRRHQRRRLVTGDFLGLLLQKVVLSGSIIITTDHEGYFLFMKETIESLWNGRGGFSREYGEGPGEFVTNFARKYLEEGRNIFRVQIHRQK